jgi:hypothetical protein
LIPLWLENILWIVSILHLLRLVLWPSKWSVLKNVRCALENNVHSIFKDHMYFHDCGIFYISCSFIYRVFFSILTPCSYILKDCDKVTNIPPGWHLSFIFTCWLLESMPSTEPFNSTHHWHHFSSTQGTDGAMWITERPKMTSKGSQVGEEDDTYVNTSEIQLSWGIHGGLVPGYQNPLVLNSLMQSDTLCT